MMEMDLTLAADTRSPGRARHALDGLRGRVSPEAIERFRLAISELVTNAIQHAGLRRTDNLQLFIQVSEARLRVEVQSGGPPFRAEARTPERTRESGRGLMLIERVADRWGMEPRDGVQMWFEIDL